MNAAIQEHTTLFCVKIFQIYFSYVLLMIFMNMKCQWEFMIKKTVVQHYNITIGAVMT